MRTVGRILGTIGVVVLMLFLASFEGCVKVHGEDLGVYVLHELRGVHKVAATTAPAPSGVVDYRSDAGHFAFAYDASRYVVNDSQAQMLESWFGKGADFAMIVFQKDKPADSPDCASLSLAAFPWPDSANTKSARKIVCSQMSITMDEGFKKVLSPSRTTIIDGASVNGLPGFVVERKGSFSGTVGRMRTLCYASKRMLYLAILWAPETERTTIVADFNQMMQSFESDGL